MGGNAMQPSRPQDRPGPYAIVREVITAIDSLGGTPGLEDLAAETGIAAPELRRVLEGWSGLPAPECAGLLARTHSARLLAGRQAALLPAGRPAAAPATATATAPPTATGTAGEIAAPDRRTRGAGLAIRWAVAESPFGPALVMATGRGICAIGFTDETGEEAALADLRARWPAAEYRHDEAGIAPLAGAAFRPGGPLPPLHLIGAPFQLRVWEVLLRIPAGEVTTYSAIARAIGHPRASRAVGTAVGRNPVSLLVPCHRVLRRDGATGGYHWGPVRKRAMLAWEAAHRAVPMAA